MVQSSFDCVFDRIRTVGPIYGKFPLNMLVCVFDRMDPYFFLIPQMVGINSRSTLLFCWLHTTAFYERYTILQIMRCLFEEIITEFKILKRK